MNLVVDEELFAIETLSFHTQLLKNTPPEKPFILAILPITDKRKRY
jgi:hypothetical protein